MPVQAWMKKEGDADDRLFRGRERQRKTVRQKEREME